MEPISSELQEIVFVGSRGAGRADKTFNASNVGSATPNHFDDGGFNFLQNTVNLDLSKKISKTFNLAFGAEFRYERYSIYKGEYGSYGAYDSSERIYPNLVGDGNGDSLRTPAAGSQGFPGFSPDDVKTAHRTNLGLYADAEWSPTDEWLLDGAVRQHGLSVAILATDQLQQYADFVQRRSAHTVPHRQQQ